MLRGQMDYQGNSNKAKAEKNEPKEKKVERVELESKVIARKKPLGSRIKAVFFGGELDAAVRYIGAEILLPAARNLGSGP